VSGARCTAHPGESADKHPALLVEVNFQVHAGNIVGPQQSSGSLPGGYRDRGPEISLALARILYRPRKCRRERPARAGSAPALLFVVIFSQTQLLKLRLRPSRIAVINFPRSTNLFFDLVVLSVQCPIPRPSGGLVDGPRSSPDYLVDYLLQHLSVVAKNLVVNHGASIQRLLLTTSSALTTF